jgi:hypothetical protein
VMAQCVCVLLCLVLRRYSHSTALLQLYICKTWAAIVLRFTCERNNDTTIDALCGLILRCISAHATLASHQTTANGLNVLLFFCFFAPHLHLLQHSCTQWRSSLATQRWLQWGSCSGLLHSTRQMSALLCKTSTAASCCRTALLLLLVILLLVLVLQCRAHTQLQV